MRKFKIKVNDKAYEVEVEEVGSTSVTTAQPIAPAVPTVESDAAPEGSTQVNAPMQGNIISVAVAKGDSVEEDDVLCVLESMKMENEIKSPVSGTIVAVGITKGATVESGDLLVAIQ